MSPTPSWGGRSVRSRGSGRGPGRAHQHQPQTHMAPEKGANALIEGLRAVSLGWVALGWGRTLSEGSRLRVLGRPSAVWGLQ